jgi:hypothetical protein
MAAPALPPTTDVDNAPESPLLAVFAVLIMIATVAIGFLIATPSVLTLVLALTVVMSFAAGVTYLLARIIGDA